MYHLLLGPLIIVLLVLLVCGWAYHVVACWCVRRRFGGSRSGTSVDGHAFTPPVSILKPLKGAGPDLLANLRGFCEQDYPEYEVLFGVRDAADPAVAVVRRLQEQCPGARLRLLIAGDGGMNPKTSILQALTAEACYGVLAWSDSDIRVEADYLRRLVAPLQDRHVGLVTCLYVADPPNRSAVELLDAMHINLTFLPSAAVASFLPVRFAFGASIAVRRLDLMQAGGLKQIADHLADDYMVARIIGRLGLSTHLTDFMVEHAAADGSLLCLWRRELRWARTLRVLEPRGFAALPLTFALLWALVLLMVSGGAAWAAGLLLATVLLRCGAAWVITGIIGLPRLRFYLPWLPIRDLLEALIWCVAWIGHRVTWRGISYCLLPDGRLAPDRAILSDNLVGMLVRPLDKFLRAREGIFQFSDDPDCLFRIGVRSAQRPAVLHDGTIIAPGQRYLELHFWNEHLATIGHARSADLAWAKAAERKADKSLKLLARYLESHDDLGDIRAIYGRTAVLARSNQQIARIIGYFGFELADQSAERGLLGRLHDRGEDLLMWALVRTFSPFARGDGPRARPRHEVWMSRRTLLERYGSSAEPVPQRGRRQRRTFGRDAEERRGRRHHGRAPSVDASQPQPGA